MFQLIHRITLALSLLSGFIISFIVLSEFFNYNNTLLLIISTLFLGFVVKQMIFSERYIKERLEFFATQIQSRLKTDTLNISPKLTAEQELELMTDEVKDMSLDKEEPSVYKQEDALEAYALQDDIDTDDTSSIPHTTQATRVKIEPSYLEKFFSENLLAKLGGILVFLGVLFLLSLVYSIVGPVTKLILGSLIGFTVYAVGIWLDTKKYTQESRVLLAIGILIQYLVILSGRYLIGSDESTGAMILSTGLTFVFLIANTLLAVATALVYKSQTLLIFSFVFAYLNIVFVGDRGLDTYTTLGYIMLVSAGAFYISYHNKEHKLFFLSLVLAAIFLLITPFENSWEWITKLLCVNILGVGALIVSKEFQKSYCNIFEILIGGIFFMIGIIGILGVMSIEPLQLIILGASSLGLMALAYTQMHKGMYLYSVGTLGTITILTPAILVPIHYEKDGMMLISIVLVLAFFVMNIATFFMKQKTLLVNNLSNLMGGLISAAIFMTFMVYNLGNKFFPGVLQGLMLLLLALIYFAIAYIFVRQVGLTTLKEDLRYTNTFYALSALSISIFTLSIAFIFGEYSEVISLIWLLEASVLFYLAHRLHSAKTALGGLALFIVGIISVVGLFDPRLSNNFGMLVGVAVIFATLIANLFFLFPKKNESEKSFLGDGFFTAHNIFHIIGVWATIALGHQILDISDEFTTLLYVAVFLAFLGYIYSLIQSRGLRITHFTFYCLLLLMHIILFAFELFGNIPLLESTLIILVCSSPFLYEYLSTRTIQNKSLFGVLLVYIFVITSLYVYHITEITFAVTMYWGFLSFVLLSYGIQKDHIKLRTVGLYIVSLTAGKVFLYDIWMSVDDTISRVVALIIIGILMIVLSTMYTRKYGNNLNKEFSFENIFPKQSEASRQKQSNPKKSKIS